MKGDPPYLTSGEASSADFETRLSVSSSEGFGWGQRSQPGILQDAGDEVFVITNWSSLAPCLLKGGSCPSICVEQMRGDSEKKKIAKNFFRVGEFLPPWKLFTRHL